MLFSPGTQVEKRGNKWFASILHLHRYNYYFNVYYASFMPTQYSAEELNQNDYDISFVTGFTGTTGNTFYTQHKGLNIPKEFGHMVDEFKSESKMMPYDNLSHGASYYILYFWGRLEKKIFLPSFPSFQFYENSVQLSSFYSLYLRYNHGVI